MTGAAIEMVATTGHNNPPSETEILRDRLTNGHAKLLDDVEKLVGSADRVPERCEDDDTAGKVGDLIKLITRSQKSVEAVRVSEKEPYLSLGRAVDGFFKLHIDRLNHAKAKAQRPLDTYLKLKAEQERQRRFEEAERLRLQAEAEAKAAAELEQAKLTPLADVAMQQAVITEQVAAKVEQTAFERPAGLAQSRGVEGSMASLRTRWVGELIDRASLDLETLRPHIPLDALQKALNAYIAAGGRELRGAKIYEKSETVVR